MVLVLAIGISYALTPIVAELNAKDEKEKISTHLRHSLALNLFVSAILFFLLWSCAPLLKLTGRPDEVADLAIRFLNVIMLSMIPLSIFFTFKQFTEGMSDTKTAMFITIGANGLNILLNYLLVFGKYGFPEMGVMGACWATFISRCMMAISMFLYVRYSLKYSKYKFAFFKGKYSRNISCAIENRNSFLTMFALEVVAFAIPTLLFPNSTTRCASVSNQSCSDDLHGFQRTWSGCNNSCWTLCRNGRSDGNAPRRIQRNSAFIGIHDGLSNMLCDIPKRATCFLQQ